MTSNKKMEVLGIKFAPLNVPRERRLQTTAVILTTLVLLIFGPPFTITFVYVLLCTKYYWLCLIYVAFVYIEGDIASRGGRQLASFRRLFVWRHLGSFFPVKLVKTVELDPSKNYLLCAFPHGIFSLGVIMNFATEASRFTEVFRGIKPHVATLGINFKLPVFRDILLALGFCSVSKESLNYLLGDADTGRATVIVIGGADESLKSKPGTYRVTLKNRKGFVKLALKNGSCLVPVFSFGETDVYDQWDNPKGSRLRAAQELLLRITGIAPIVFLGRGIFQYSFGIMPRRRPITTVVGKPMNVTKVADPSEREIDELHKRFMENLTNLFEDEKQKYIENAQDISLVIE